MEIPNYSILLKFIFKKKEIDLDEEKEKSTVLFFKIWRNTYLKNYILRIVKLYFTNGGWHTFTLESLNNNKNKDYFNKIILKNPIVVKNNSMQLGKYYNKQDEENEKKSQSIQLPKYSIKYLKFTTRVGKDNVVALYPGFIPSSVTCLEMDHHFNIPLSKDIIPNSVTDLTFGNEFNQSIEVGDLPSSIQKITFGNMFNKPLKKFSIPDRVISITFGIEFDQEIEVGVLPSSCVELIFGQKFNKRFKKGSIPNGVKSLKLSTQYTNPIEPNVLPPSITYINIGSSFYSNKVRKIDKNTFPGSFVEVRYRGAQDYSIDESSIPSNIKLLKYDLFF
ncbi:hypothetical protein ACTFIV_004216 [Dictyostelium citrinum]